jgi:hypothetical protein
MGVEQESLPPWQTGSGSEKHSLQAGLLPSINLQYCTRDRVEAEHLLLVYLSTRVLHKTIAFQVQPCLWQFAQRNHIM